MENEGILEAQHPTLKELGLYGNQIGNDGVRAIFKALRTNLNLRVLWLGNNQLGSDAVVDILLYLLQHNATLTKLDLGWNKIGDRGTIYLVRTLIHNTRLEWLNLEANQIHDKGARAFVEPLRQNKTLSELSLGYNEIGNDGICAICDSLIENTTLKVLCLGKNQIGIDGVCAISDVLKVNKTLKTLDLGGNKIGNDGAIVLAGALEQNATVTFLGLFNSQIGNDGGRAIRDALKENMTLRELWLGGNPIDQNILDEISALLERNKLLFGPARHMVRFSGSEFIRTNLKESALLERNKNLAAKINQQGSQIHEHLYVSADELHQEEEDLGNLRLFNSDGIRASTWTPAAHITSGPTRHMVRFSGSKCIRLNLEERASNTIEATASRRVILS